MNPNLHIGPITAHIRAIERWPEGAFAYPTDHHNPLATAACRECGARCDRRSMRCATCRDAERARYCKRGHDLTDPAVVHFRKGDGARFCRVCDRVRKAIARKEGRAA